MLRAELVLRRHGVHHRPPAYIRGMAPRISNLGRLQAGAGLRLDGLQHRIDIGTGPAGILRIGRDVFINRGVTIYAEHSVSIGDNVRIADLASIHDSDLHQVEEGASVRVAPIVIGNNVWIGRAAIILPGVTIGDHAVIAAGALVNRDVPERSLAAGVPARPVRELRASSGWVRD